MPRPDGRQPAELRRVEILLGLQKHAEGSVLVRCGDTHVICAASVEEKVPPFLEGKGLGWVTAEYGMLPRSTTTRVSRAPDGRQKEISRLIGRALRAGVDRRALGPRTVTLDCDVLQADGGTRTAAITGAWVALAVALRGLVAAGRATPAALGAPISAISVGVVDGEPRLDLCYAEDAAAEVDLNVVACDDRIVEIQGTAEGSPFARDVLDRLLDLGLDGARTLGRLQLQALAGAR